MEIHYAGEWAALYVDGTLDIVGDSYIAEERAFGLLGVLIVQDDAFMLGQEKRDGVAATLEGVASYRAERTKRQERAAELRAQADALVAEADALVKR